MYTVGVLLGSCWTIPVELVGVEMVTTALGTLAPLVLLVTMRFECVVGKRGVCGKNLFWSLALRLQPL